MKGTGQRTFESLSNKVIFVVLSENEDENYLKIKINSHESRELIWSPAGFICSDNKDVWDDENRKWSVQIVNLPNVDIVTRV